MLTCGGVIQLFEDKPFIGHAGPKLLFKIECDALTDDDLETLAAIIARRHTFGRVLGIPSGGFRLAHALEKYRSSVDVVLIVDDVLTTGKSMEDMRDQTCKDKVIGVVIFARGKCPSWVTPIFQLSAWAGP